MPSAVFVLGDVGQPQLVRSDRGELVAGPPVLVGDGAQVVVDRRAGFLAVTAPLLPERGSPTVARCDPPRGPIRHRLTSLASLVSEQPVTELGVIFVRVEQRVRSIRLHDLAGCDGVGQPPVVRLARELQNPTRHRDRDPVSSELRHEQLEPFPGRLACDR